jgi:hypothetical protein
MLERFYLLPFLAGIVVGIFLITTFKSETPVVMRYPHPDNVNGRIYKDKNNVCYQYKSNLVDCDTNEDTLKPYPLQ